MTAILIEDEERSRRSLKALLARLGDDVEVVGEADTVSNAVELIDRVKPDVVFMDIVLREGTGFDVLHKVSGDFDLVFITAYDEYALRAFKFSAIDYLLKPIDPDDLEAALLKIRKRQRRTRTADRQLFQEMMEQKPKRPERMVVPVVDGLEVIPLRNILYCQADRNYTNIVMIDGKKLVSSKTLKHYEDMLTTCDFFRVHNSYLINLGQIRKYHKTSEGIVEMNNGYKIDVARSRKGALLQAISELG